MAEELQLSLRSPDLDKMLDQLAATPHIARQELRSATIDSLAFAQRQLAIYPPPPPASRYRRTGTLGRRWRFLHGSVRAGPGRVTGSVFNVTPYAQWVQDERRQARVHRGRWNTIQQMTRGTSLKAYRLYFGRALKRIANRLKIGG